jgi:plastocyanin
MTLPDIEKTVFTRLFFISTLLLSPLSVSAATFDVAVQNNSFSPNNLTIEVGDTVRWTNNSGRTHDVTADNAVSPLARHLTALQKFSTTARYTAARA